MERIGHIVLAADGSEGALAAAAMAGLLARNCNSRVSVVIVHGEDALTLPGVTEALLPGTTFHAFPKKDARKHIEKTAQEHVVPAVEAALGTVPGGIEIAQLWGHAADQICTYASTHEADLIVMGKRGSGTFKRLLLGGVSRQVMEHAPCAVTVVG